uniref:Uncharacterized protein n=1 Tax=Tanacetum cinerariifolium TaxID=118510 RepID=A0A6L2NFJ7_TANCI|nr:hypothetical protein [Tanacetum cinerariifolium]
MTREEDDEISVALDPQEVIEFGDSYKAPLEEAASESSAKKKGRTVVITTEDMQKRRNDVKARTTLLLALPDEHQLRFNNRKCEVHTTSVPTVSTQVSTASVDVVAANISHETVCAYIASQSNGSQIKYEDITQIDKDDIEEIDINWNMALLNLSRRGGTALYPRPSLFLSVLRLPKRVCKSFEADSKPSMVLFFIGNLAPIPSNSINSHQSLGSWFFLLRTLFVAFSSTPVLTHGYSVLPSKMAYLVAIDAFHL